MRKLYGVIGFLGFIIIIGGTGDFDNASFAQTLKHMTIGSVMLFGSIIFSKIHKLQRRRNKAFSYKTMPYRRVRFCEQKRESGREISTRIKPGIASIIKGNYSTGKSNFCTGRKVEI